MFEAVSAYRYSINYIGIFFSRWILSCAQSHVSEKFNACKSWLFGNVCGTRAQFGYLSGTPVCCY